uniref:Uncharacterized protein n=1 Tax=Arundo donax TaxID=35708 RepID=A0A0A9DT89_ARUDO
MTSRTGLSSSSGSPLAVGPYSGSPRSCTGCSPSVLSSPWRKLEPLLPQLGIPRLHQTWHPTQRAHRYQLLQLSSWLSSPLS